MKRPRHILAIILAFLLVTGMVAALVFFEIAPEVHASSITQAAGLQASGFYLVNGTTNYCGPTFAVCTPASGLTIVNTAGASSMISVGGTQALSVAASATTNNGVMAGKSIAGTATSLTLAISCLPFSDSTTTTVICGAGFGKNSTGQIITVYMAWINTGGVSAYQIVYWSNQTTISASLTTSSGMTFNSGSGVWWVRLTCSVPGCGSGTMAVSTSADGTTFSPGYSEAVGTHFSPDQWGAVGSAGSTTQTLTLNIQSFKVLP